MINTTHRRTRTPFPLRITGIALLLSAAFIDRSAAADDEKKAPTIEQQMEKINQEETLTARRLKRLEALRDSTKDTYSFALHNALRHCYQSSNMEKEGWMECNIILENQPMEGYIVGVCLASGHLNKDNKRAIEALQGVLRKTGDYPFIQAASLIQLGDLLRAQKKDGMAKNQYTRVLKLTAPGMEPYTKLAQQRLEKP